MLPPRRFPRDRVGRVLVAVQALVGVILLGLIIVMLYSLAKAP